MDQNRPAEIANNKEEVPLQFYLERFPMIDPEERAEQLGVPFENGAFTVTMLGVTYRIAWPSGEVSSDDPEAIAVRKIPGQIMLAICGTVIYVSAAFVIKLTKPIEYKS
jgi:hypothetical protein